MLICSRQTETHICLRQGQTEQFQLSRVIDLGDLYATYSKLQSQRGYSTNSREQRKFVELVTNKIDQEIANSQLLRLHLQSNKN